MIEEEDLQALQEFPKKDFQEPQDKPSAKKPRRGQYVFNGDNTEPPARGHYVIDNDNTYSTESIESFESGQKI